MEQGLVHADSQWSKPRVEEGLKNGTVRFSKTANGWSLHHKVYMNDGQVLRSLLTEYGNNRSSGKQLEELFGKVCFDYAKPTQLIKVFLQLCTCGDDVVLDFFSGSATTAHAVMELNAEDNRKRKFGIKTMLPNPAQNMGSTPKLVDKGIL